MYLDHRVIGKIANSFKKTGLNILLLDNNGRVILPSGDSRELPLPEALRKNPTEPFVYGDFTLIGTEGANPLFLCLPGNAPEVSSCAVVTAELVNLLTRVELPPADREQTMHSVLCEKLSGVDLESLAEDFCIPLEKERTIMLFYLSGGESETMLSVLRNASEDCGDIVVEIDRRHVALVKEVFAEEGYDELHQYAQAILTTLEAEGLGHAEIGIGQSRTRLDELADCYEEAKSAIDVGVVYRPDSHVYSYRSLLLERFLSELPRDMCEHYHDMIFSHESSRLFNDEMVHTIEKFFENNLNLSETARQIFIHRNTLVYRLDKLQRTIGLDLRNFDDAMTFKLMMLMGKKQ